MEPRELRVWGARHKGCSSPIPPDSQSRTHRTVPAPRFVECYLPEFCGLCCGLDAEFCCAASVLPDDTCAIAGSVAATVAAAKISKRGVLKHSFPGEPT
jgi:hypothetical protein